MQNQRQQQTDLGDDHMYKNSSQTYELNVEKVQPIITWDLAVPITKDNVKDSEANKAVETNTWNNEPVPFFVGQKMTAKDHLNAVFKKRNAYTDQYVDMGGSDPKGLHSSFIRYQLICRVSANDPADAPTLRRHPVTNAVVDVPPAATDEDLARLDDLGYTEKWKALPLKSGKVDVEKEDVLPVNEPDAGTSVTAVYHLLARFDPYERANRGSGRVSREEKNSAADPDKRQWCVLFSFNTRRSTL